MANSKQNHEANASAAGYLYQCRTALLLSLRAIPVNLNQEVSVERFDDVAFDTMGTPSELIQTKHHIEKSGNLTNASSDLWKTLLIWSKAVKADAQLPFRMKFFLMTTGSAPDGSACSFLRAVANERNEAEADKLLLEIAATSKNSDHTQAYEIYQGLSQEVRISLLRSITVLDNAPNIIDVLDEIHQALYMAAPKSQIANFAERLEGWWFARVIDGLINKKSIPLLAIDQRIDELREDFQRNSLPVDVKGAVPSPEIVAELDKRRFVKQLRRIKIGTSRIELAIRDYYRAFEQRSRWTRQELLVDGELGRYEDDLKEAWEPRFLSLLDSLPNPCMPETKVSGGQKIFQWAEQDADFPLRTVRERFLTHGSFQILANRNVVGWHPDFKELDEVDDPEKDKK
ncbi:MAG TPA: ABC-three component system protein [Terriglobales bacterium]|nr:ABC-three component system protein [Terriglobales bacterium]